MFYHVRAPLRKLMQEPTLPVDPLNPSPPSSGENQPAIVAVFLRPDGMLRAGWRLLLYLLMGFALVFGMRFVLGSLRHMGINAIWRGFISEATLAIVALVPALVMARIEHRSLADYGLPARTAFGRHFWVGTAWGLGSLTILLLVLRASHVFYFGGIALPFARGKLKDGKKTRIIAVEPTAAPSLTKGVYTYDFGDTAQLTPLVKMHTLGSSFIPAPIHAGGLRYHGMAPIICKLYDEGVIEAIAVPQNPVFEAAIQFARAEGIVPAPESAHAIRAAIDEALKAKAAGEKKVILFNLSGHGHFDLAGYQQYMAGALQDFEYPRAEVEKAISGLPKVSV